MVRRRVLSLAAFVLAFGLGASVGWAEIRVVEPDKPETLPAFALSDHKGQPFTAERYKGHWSLTTIGFTSCPDVCPFVLSNIVEVISQMTLRVHPDKLPQVVFVGVDPGRDAPVMADYVAHFDPKFIGVTGPHEELAKLVTGIDGFYRIGKAKKDGDYEVQHSASVIVTGPDGQVHAKLSPPLDPGKVAEYLARKQIAYARAQRSN
ncbi:MAG TPA: SCO family protein [Rhodospirillaceae bacterium]|nr:SCO family protein [Rhodospirillaceae bacterium]|tara:strand:- start:144 stop:761 length:618 start_codon:yes stop_codon:yes gene_type:complete